MNRLIRYGILFLSFLGMRSLSAQDISRHRLDSLIQVADTIQDDSLRIRAMYAVANSYFLTYIDSSGRCYEYLNKGIQLSQEQDDPLNELRGWNDLGTFTREDGLLDSSNRFYGEAIRIAEENDFEEAYYQMKDNLSVNYGALGKFDEALALKQEALDYFKSTNDSLSITITLANIGKLYADRSNFTKALPYFLQSMSYSYPTDTLIMGVLWGNVGASYKNLELFDSARMAFDHARNLSRFNDPRSYLRNSFNTGLMFAEMDSFSQALEIFEEINENADRYDFSDYYYYQVNMAHCYTEIGEYEKARTAFNIAKDQIQDSELPNHRLRYRETAYDLAMYDKDYQEALKQFQAMSSIRDTLYSLEKETAFAEIEEKYEAEKKERIIQEQRFELVESQNRQNLLSIGIASILLISGISIFFINRARKTEKALQVAEINSLKQENKLISLQAMLQGQEEERKRIARDLHDNIGAMMTTLKMKVMSIQRQIEDLEQLNIAKELDSMIGNAATEIRRISHQMTPVALELAGLKGAVSDLVTNISSQGIRVTSDLEALDLIQDQETQIVLFRVLQELGNNVMKHSQATTFQLKTRLSQNRIVIDMQDNGVGIDPAVWEEGSSSLGLRSIKSRIAYLDGDMTLKEGEGTHFRISIPV